MTIKVRTLMAGSVSLFIIGVLIAAFAWSSPKPPPRARAVAPTTVYTPPTSISTTCASDATAALNKWLSSLPAFATASLPSKACYLVSNSPTSLLLIHQKWGLTLNGNGSTFRQSSYAPANDPQAPVLTIGGNLNLTINNLTLRGPSSVGGGNVEGDIGVLMWQNAGVALNSVTIENVEGDGLDVYPLGNEPGVNWYVSLNHSTIENVGYHAIVPEAADYFAVTNSTISTGDIDAEVDFSCQGHLPDCGTLADPLIGVVNMTLSGDSFPNGLALEDGMSCMPVGNWALRNNNLGSGGLDLQFDTTYSLALSALESCGLQSGLTIAGNTSTGQSQHDCCGSGSPFIILQGWTGVTISGNHLVFDPANAPAGDALADLWADNGVSIANNTFANLNTITTTNLAPAGWPKDLAVTVCGNGTGPKGATHGTTCK